MACALSWPSSATEARGGTERTREGGVDAGRRVRCTGTSPLMNAPGMCEGFYVHRRRRRLPSVYTLHYRHHPRTTAAATATLVALSALQLSLPRILPSFVRPSDSVLLSSPGRRVLRLASLANFPLSVSLSLSLSLNLSVVSLVLSAHRESG